MPLILLRSCVLLVTEMINAGKYIGILTHFVRLAETSLAKQWFSMGVGGWEMHWTTGSFILGRRSYFSQCRSASNGQSHIFMPLKSTKPGNLELLMWLFLSNSCLQTQNECNISCRAVRREWGKKKKEKWHTHTTTTSVLSQDSDSSLARDEIDSSAGGMWE